MEIMKKRNISKLTCRLCSQKFVASSVVNLFKYQTQVFGEHGQVVLPIAVIRKYNSHHFKISSDDNLPQQICHDCLYSFISINEFIESCLKSQEKLENESRNLENQKLTSKFECTETVDDNQELNNNVASIITTNFVTNSNNQKEKIIDIDFRESRKSAHREKLKDKPTKKSAEESIDEMMQYFMQQNNKITFDDEPIELKFHGKSETITSKINESHSEEEYFNDNFKEDSRIMCRFCFKEATTVQELEDHEEKKHKHKISSKFMICECCGKLVKTYEFDDHVVCCHNGKLPHFCDVCNKGFTKLRNLKVHQIRNHKNDSQEIFKSESFHCTKCKRNFTNVGALNLHMENAHSNQKTKEIIKPTFQCDICNKKFRNVISLETHRNIHKNQKSLFPCPECDRHFSRRDHLKYHVKMFHLKENPYKCDICNQAFPIPYILNNHKKVKHNKVTNRVKCNLCCRTFYDHKYLTRHHLENHTVGSQYVCIICDSKFNKKAQLLLHAKIHNTEKLLETNNDKNDLKIVEYDLNEEYIQEEIIACETLNEVETAVSALITNKDD